MTTTIPESVTYEATLDQIMELRDLVDEPTEDPFTDAILGTIIDASDGDLITAAKAVWVRKSARLAKLVDVREGNSDRKLSQLHKQALEMVAQYTALTAASPEATTRRSRTRKIDRQ